MATVILLPRSIRVALVAALLLGLAAAVILAGAFAIGRWSSVAWTAAFLLAILWFVRATLRRDRRARLVGLPVSIALGTVFVVTLATKLAILLREDRGDAGETFAIAGAALPFVLLAAALTRRSAVAWFARRA